MAGLSGKTAYIGVAKQTAKGSAATVAKYVNPFTGGSAGPERVVDRLQETDSNLDPGSAYLVRGGAAGSPEFYVRPKSFPAYARAGLGVNTTSGAGPYVHTMTTATSSLPYMSFFRMLGATVYERLEDCLVNSISVRSEAGQALVCTLNFLGLKPTRSATEWASTPTLENEAPWFYHQGTVTIAGSTVTNVRSFEITLENNVTQQQTDDITLYDVVPGTRNLTFSFDMIFDSSTAFDEYKKFHYGTTSGTAQSTTLYTTDVTFSFTNGADIVQFAIPVAAYEEFPAEPDAGGDPVVSSVRGAAIRSASPITTWTVTNTVANAAGVNYG